MQTIIKLDIEDIKQIVSNYFGVYKEDVFVIGCGNDTGDGIYPGSGYYCDIEVKKND